MVEYYNCVCERALTAHMGLSLYERLSEMQMQFLEHTNVKWGYSAKLQQVNPQICHPQLYVADLSVYGGFCQQMHKRALIYSIIQF